MPPPFSPTSGLRSMIFWGGGGIDSSNPQFVQGGSICTCNMPDIDPSNPNSIFACIDDIFFPTTI